MLGRKFSRKTERYAELYSQHSARRPANGNTENELTLAIGTRRPITRSGGLRLLAMAGRSAHRATLANGEPSWIAYIGLQVRVVKTENEGDFRLNAMRAIQRACSIPLPRNGPRHKINETATSDYGVGLG